MLASFDLAAGAKATHEQKKEGGNLEIQLDEALDLSLDKIDIKPADPNNLISHKEQPDHQRGHPQPRR